MKYLYCVAAFVMLLNVSVSQEVQVGCYSSDDCVYLPVPREDLLCFNGRCMCAGRFGDPQSCDSFNATTKATAVAEAQRAHAPLQVGRICAHDKDCREIENALCNTTRKQCGCKNNFISATDNRRCLPVLQFNSSGCEMEKQCLAASANTTCTNGVCLCAKNYHYSSGSCWEKKAFSSSCSVTPECNHVLEAVCDSQHRCSCPVDRVIDSGISTCLPIASKFGDNCVEAIQCTQLLGEGGTCQDQRCRCREHHHHSPHSYKCNPNLAVGENCFDDNECSQAEGKDETPTMKCIDNLCVCREGLEELRGKCEPIKQDEERVGSEKSAANRLKEMAIYTTGLAFLTYSWIL